MCVAYPTPPTHPPTYSLIIRATIRDITVAVKKVAKNPAVLASYVAEIVTKH